ncbi:hypothetical protein VT03_16915 [Planctomyces sp. SH-PL14]|nr:hypothetical protein VT03_16915 [Planctomyces sp. SH-PL14]
MKTAKTGKNLGRTLRKQSLFLTQAVRRGMPGRSTRPGVFFAIGGSCPGSVAPGPAAWKSDVAGTFLSALSPWPRHTAEFLKDADRTRARSGCSALKRPSAVAPSNGQLLPVEPSALLRFDDERNAEERARTICPSPVTNPIRTFRLSNGISVAPTPGAISVMEPGRIVSSTPCRPDSSVRISVASSSPIDATTRMNASSTTRLCPKDLESTNTPFSPED